MGDSNGSKISLTYPGSRIFNQQNCLRYFTIDSIIGNELRDNPCFDLIKEGPTTFALNLILQKCAAASQPVAPEEVVRSSDSSPSGKSQESLRSSTPSTPGTPLEKHAFEFFKLYNQSRPMESIENDSRCRRRATKKRSIKLSPLFYLMSILPASDATECQRLLNRDEFPWEISFRDILLVFLNWGATMKDFRFEKEGSLKNDAHTDSESLKNVASGATDTVRDNVPSAQNIKLVLTTISKRVVKSPMSELDRVLLLRVLVHSATEDQRVFRREMMSFRQAVSAVVHSFKNWDHEKAVKVAEALDLKHMNVQNASCVCCCLLVSTSPTSRLGHLGECASYNVLRHHYKLTSPGQTCIFTLADTLLTLVNNNLRYSMCEVFVLAQLVELLLMNFIASPAYDKEVVDKLMVWAEYTFELVKYVPQDCSLDSAHVRERLNRFIGMCKKRQCRVEDEREKGKDAETPCGKE